MILRVNISFGKSPIYGCLNDVDRFMRSIDVQAPPIKKIKLKIQLFISCYRHHWLMYDGDDIICKNGFTKKSNPDGLNLHEGQKQSVYVEGIK